jgi:site-specific recombinase XerD
MPIEVLQKVLGHESIRTTQIYAKVLQENVDAEFDKLDAIDL